MIAFDTNMLVRLVVDDDPQQADLAERLLREHRVWISRTVLLETEWVLRSRYRITAELEDTESVAKALSWYGQGADFADALHLAVCGDIELHTFDRDFCKAARSSGQVTSVRVWSREESFSDQ
ncbi:type II toxin-antitoxin system VapC family toxin [Thiorhodovibrio frisius]|uniref:Putative nucleic-acid-binding protein n=1 Tax=Thiorhodovibrio frisius TaxID=631362 RepID=H8Z1X0_9GAMM|nr:type II toxin-antitoxin system VapC family toxin [Thiorhodovibrio frisius]EIC22598.1 putative nucleic-acid-binding protein [Thiorhodovibrio frisius]WPL20039.1 PIN domain protein [Thiorhodovibrio frisius]